MELQEFFEQNPKAARGFSGGVDSAYLLYAAKKYGADVKPYYIKTAFQPRFEYADVRMLCDKLGVDIKVIEYDILSESIIASNPKDRCYYCKKSLFTILKNEAEKDGYNLILDGTNASDDLSDRPGAKALEELSVRSPLRECGLTKDTIRALSKEAGLFTWNKPSYSCLATRIPADIRITADDLWRIEQSESALMAMGFTDFRVRLYNGAARLQLKHEQFLKAADRREEIVTCIRPYFQTILLDMEARGWNKKN